MAAWRSGLSAATAALLGDAVCLAAFSFRRSLLALGRWLPTFRAMAISSPLKNSHSRTISRRMPAHVGAGVPARISTHRGLSPRSYDVALGRSNHLYSVAALTNGAGSVVERYRYDTYGQRQIVTKGTDNTWGTADDGVATASAYGNQIGFTGRYLDKETGLYYFRARYYSGRLGRFIGRDSLDYISGTSLYCAFFVPGKTDPSGYCPSAKDAYALVKGTIEYQEKGKGDLGDHLRDAEMDRLFGGLVEAEVNGLLSAYTNSTFGLKPGSLFMKLAKAAADAGAASIDGGIQDALDKIADLSSKAATNYCLKKAFSLPDDIVAKMTQKEVAKRISDMGSDKMKELLSAMFNENAIYNKDNIWGGRASISAFFGWVSQDECEKCCCYAVDYHYMLTRGGAAMLGGAFKEGHAHTQYKWCTDEAGKTVRSGPTKTVEEQW